MSVQFNIRPLSDSDKSWVASIIQTWGGDFIVSRGKKHYPAELKGFCAESDSGEKIGLVIYDIAGDQCEMVTLDAFKKFVGVGSALTEKLRGAARDAGCKRLWLITTNDNLDAVRFYQKRGFIITAIYVDALTESRKLKPAIPTIGCYGIPMRDEIELEMIL
ncbi:GNAT family N-acetyltransferase [Elusimicrobiota bacterium]